ncbi:histone acetyltransferase KAT6B-like [Uloborus diversus]|uniref:histone acetyltransferase KAT6B-like n=1 Tax=Uloborus diversus TaxID=327109 RepID=UPI00240A1339|nr:histone acetyltransferase KAT6B-like [Uloborus diversus]
MCTNCRVRARKDSRDQEELLIVCKLCKHFIHMGCSHLPGTKFKKYSWSCCSCVEKQTMRFKSNKVTGTAEAEGSPEKQESSSSQSATPFCSTKTWPSFQIPIKKQWHRRQAFMDNFTASEEKNPFLAALENSKNESLSSCLRDVNKSSDDSFNKSNFLIQPFSSAKGNLFRPKPKGLVDGLSRFFTPTNKRKSRVAISSLGDSLTLGNEMQVEHAADDSFSGKQFCDQTAVNEETSDNELFVETQHKLCADPFVPSGKISSPSNVQPSFNANSKQTMSLNVQSPSAKPSGSGPLKNLFDGLSHLYTASTDTRKRGQKVSNHSLPSPKRVCKDISGLKEKNLTVPVFCDRNSTGDSLLDKSSETKSEVENVSEYFETDVENTSSSASSSSFSNNVKMEFSEAEPSPSYALSDSKSTSSPLSSSVPENTFFGEPNIVQESSNLDVKDNVDKKDFDENKEKINKEENLFINVTEDDILLFKRAQQIADQNLGYDSSSTARKPSLIQFGQYEIAVVYSSPYPKEYLRLPKLVLCEFCFKFMKSIKTLDRHMMKCSLKHPPADEIYRKGDLSIFEVDGIANKTYCQNLCLLAKLFLERKTLFYDVESFLFYILTKNDRNGCHFVGYFSKEKFCQQRYNLSCLMVMPQHRRNGYGRFLIDFSYLLSQKEGRCGTPEKPLSNLGHICYESYWESVVLEHLSKVDRKKKITIKSICRATGMTFLDVVSTLTVLNMITRNELGKLLVTVDEKSLEVYMQEISRKKIKRIILSADCLSWEPQRNSKNDNCKKCKKEASKIRDKKRQLVNERSKSNNKIEKVFIGGEWYSKERIKCETCLLSQERERRKLLKHKNKRKLAERHIELDTILAEPKKKRLKLPPVHSSVLDSSDDSADYVKFTTAKIRNLKRKWLKKHKLKMQKRFEEQKQETDILKYAVLGESRSSKIKVHSFLRKSSKVNIECQKKMKHKRFKKERYKKLRKKDKSKCYGQELTKDKKKHKVKMKKKENKSSEKDGDREGVQTPPVLLPAVLSEDDSSREENSASEHDLLPPPLLQASVVETVETIENVVPLPVEEKDEIKIEIQDVIEIQQLVNSPKVEAENLTTEVLEEVIDENEDNETEDVPVHHVEQFEEEKEIDDDIIDKSEKIEETFNEETSKEPKTVETADPCNSAITNMIDRAVAPLFADVEVIEENTFYNEVNNDSLEDSPVVVEKSEFVEVSAENEISELRESVDLAGEEMVDINSSKNMSNDSVEVIFPDQSDKMEIHSLRSPEPSMHNNSESLCLHNELKNEEEENEVREAVEVINEQMEHSSGIDMPLTPQTPESDHSRHFRDLSPYQPQHDCENSIQEVDDSNNEECQDVEDDPINKMSENVQECRYHEQLKNVAQRNLNAGNDSYSQDMMDQPEIIVDIPQVSQPLSQSSQLSSQMSNPSTPVGTIVSKHTPTPQEMSSMGVYTPDSSTNSGYNSVEIDVCQLGLESPTSVCSSEIAQNSVEATRSSTPQSYPDCAQLNNASPYCANVSISEACSNPTRREMIAAAAAAQAAVVQAQAQAHHTNQSSHCVNVSNRKRQHSNAAIAQRIANIPSAGPVSSLMQSSMVSVNATAVNALFVGPAPNTNNGYMNAMNMSVPCSNATAGGGPVAGSYMVGVPVATVIQPQSAAAFAAASMQNHHQLQQSPQNFSVASHPSGTISGAMQRLTHVGVSPSIAPNTCPVSSVTPNFHIQSPSYTYTPTPTPTPNTPSQIGTSCSLAKLQQLTNGIMDIVPNPPCNTMTPPPNMTPPSPQVNMTPPPQMQRSITPAMTGLQPQLPMQSNSHSYSKYHFHHRQMQRNPNVALSPNLVASYQTINGVGYRIQQAPTAAAMLNTGYITNASFINQAQLPPSAAVQMGMVNVNMHGQTPYQETLQPNRPQNAMYTTYSYHISGNLQPPSINSVMRR